MTQTSYSLDASRCPRCGAANHITDLLCGKCGAPLPWGAIVADATSGAELVTGSITYDQYKAAFHEAGIGMLLFGLDATMVECNRAVCEFLGYSASELKAMPVAEFSHPDDYATDLASMQRLLAGEYTSYQIEKRYLHRNGHTVWGQLHVKLVGDATGEPRFFICQIQDITARKAADTKQAELMARVRSERQRINDIVQAVPGVVWEAWGDPDASDQRIEFVSDYVETMLGYTVEDWLSTRNFWLTIVHPDDRERAAATAAQHYEAGGGVNRFRWLTRDGREIDVEGIATVIRDDAGRPIGMRGVTIDVTERNRRLEYERRARTEAEHASRMKDEFLATVSHELRTPLNAILGWVQVLNAESLSPADLHRGLEVIDRNARAQAQLIEDLLDMSRIITGQLRLAVERVALTGIVEAAIAAVQPAAQAKNIALTTELAADNDQVTGDPTRLQQIVWNLLSNAIKFTPCGGEVHVALTRTAQQIEVCVRDTGQGIASDFLPHVFDRFRQADASTTRRFSGLGLGLGIVQQLVELHGGTVSAASMGVGQGATFTVSLPFAATREHGPAESPLRRTAPVPTATDTQTPVVQAKQPELRGIEVLVVDDDADARTLVEFFLEQAGARVRTAGSAAAALELLRERCPHVLLSDIAMPGEDGYGLIRQVRALPVDAGGAVPAVALTALARSEDRTRSLLAGFNLHLAKPVDPAELLAVVANVAGLTGKRGA